MSQGKDPEEVDFDKNDENGGEEQLQDQAAGESTAITTASATPTSADEPVQEGKTNEQADEPTSGQAAAEEVEQAAAEASADVEQATSDEQVDNAEKVNLTSTAN